MINYDLIKKKIQKNINGHQRSIIKYLTRRGRKCCCRREECHYSALEDRRSSSWNTQIRKKRADFKTQRSKINQPQTEIEPFVCESFAVDVAADSSRRTRPCLRPFEESEGRQRSKIRLQTTISPFGPECVRMANEGKFSDTRECRCEMLDGRDGREGEGRIVLETI